MTGTTLANTGVSEANQGILGLFFFVLLLVFVLFFAFFVGGKENIVKYQGREFIQWMDIASVII